MVFGLRRQSEAATARLIAPSPTLRGQESNAVSLALVAAADQIEVTTC
jgi:hypothetical protein